MNQLEMNKVATHFIHTQSLDVSRKLQEVLADDLKERADQIGGPATHCVHNTALFETLLAINCRFREQDPSRDALREYLEYAQPLESKFLDIIEALKDFEPTGRPPNQGEDGAQ